MSSSKQTARFFFFLAGSTFFLTGSQCPSETVKNPEKAMIPDETLSELGEVELVTCPPLPWYIPPKAQPTGTTTGFLFELEDDMLLVREKHSLLAATKTVPGGEDAKGEKNLTWPNQAYTMEEMNAFRTRFNTPWPEGIIYYEIDPVYPAPEVVLKAMKSWEKSTNGVVQFKKGKGRGDYVYVSEKDDRIAPLPQQNSGTGGAVPGYVRPHAQLGYTNGIGKHRVVVPVASCPYECLLHELGHSLGLVHEHQRRDRDLYIGFTSCPEADMGARYRYRLDTPIRRDYGEYDFHSIMHYPTSFMAYQAYNEGKEQVSIMVSKVPGKSVPVLHPQEISMGDVYSVTCLYRPLLNAANGKVCRSDLDYALESGVQDPPLPPSKKDGSL